MKKSQHRAHLFNASLDRLTALKEALTQGFREPSEPQRVTDEAREARRIERKRERQNRKRNRNR